MLLVALLSAPLSGAEEPDCFSNPPQEEWLREQGVQLPMGYYFYKPAGETDQEKGGLWKENNGKPHLQTEKCEGLVNGELVTFYEADTDLDPP